MSEGLKMHPVWDQDDDDSASDTASAELATLRRPQTTSLNGSRPDGSPQMNARRGPRYVLWVPPDHEGGNEPDVIAFGDHRPKHSDDTKPPGGQKERAPALAGAKGSSNGQAVNLNPEYTTIPESAFKGPFTLSTICGLMDQFNLRYAVVNEGGKCPVFHKVWDDQLKRHRLERISFADFKRMFSNRIIAVNNGESTAKKNAADYWLCDSRRRQYLGGVVFDPACSARADCWNLWQGFTVVPHRGDWSLMHGHLLHVVSGGNQKCFEYLLNWLARMFQHPELQGEVAIVLRGKKGAGKGVVAKYPLRAFGQHGLHISDPKHLMGNFNGHLRDAVFIFADEAFAVTDSRQEGILKGLITEPTILLEAKYQNPISVPNMTHILMASNCDWVVPASAEERRFFVLDVLDTHVGDQAYFNALNEQMENGGLPAMIFDLLHRDISAFDHRSVPRTSALDDQKRHSLSSLEKWFRDVLDRGYLWRSHRGNDHFTQWRGFESTELLYDSYRQWAQETREKKTATREQLGVFLSSMYAQKRPSGACVIREVPIDDGKGDGMVRKERPMGYDLGDLASARKAFCDRVGLCFGWEKE